MIRSAAKLAGLEFSDAEFEGMVQPVNQSLARMRAIRATADSERRGAAVLLQPADAGHGGGSQGAAAAVFEGASGQAAGGSRNRRVLAGQQAVGAHQESRGQLARAHADVSRATGEAQREAQLRCNDASGCRHRAGEAGRCRARSGSRSRPAARCALGREGHHFGEGLSDHVGLGRLQGSGFRLRRRASSSCCAKRVPCCSRSSRRASSPAAISGGAGAPTIHGSSMKGRADRRRGPARRPLPGVCRLPLAPRRAARS